MFGPTCCPTERSRNTARAGVLIFYKDISEVTGTREQCVQKRTKRARENFHVMEGTLFSRLPCYQEGFVIGGDKKQLLHINQYRLLVKMQRIHAEPRD